VGLFQKPPQTQEELEANRPLDVAPDAVLEMDEEEWYAKVYRGEDAPQLTVRAVLLGSGLGFFLALTNVYIGLKTGWHLGVAITACILAYAISNALVRARMARTPLTILETNCLQSTASAAGYSTGGTMVSAIPALLMLSVTAANPGGEHLPWPVLAAWTLFLAGLGCVIAIPMKRSMINRERLKFPSGTAAAVTLQSLYSRGSSAGRKAKALLWSALLGAVVPILIDLKFRTKEVVDGATGAVKKIPDTLLQGTSRIFDWLPARGVNPETGAAYKPSDWLIQMDHNPVMIAAGMIVGLRTAFYMVIGSLALLYVLGPAGHESSWLSTATGEPTLAVTHPSSAYKEVGIWFGVPLMVSYALLSFATQWRTIARAFSGLKGGGAGESERVRRTEVPTSWFLWGTALCGIGVITIAHTQFEVPWFFGALAVLLTFFLALVACRVTGESDITPTGPLGKLMQLTYGVLIPQSTTANLMTAGITAGAAGASADLLTDLKSGYLLGANPRRQFVAQFLGIFTGTAATVLCFYLLVPDASALIGANGQAPDFPAPAAQAWKAVAEVFKLGFANMHPMFRDAIVWGAGLGAVLLLLERGLPKFKRHVPSATGIGLGMVLPFQYPLSMLLGAVIGFVWTRRHNKSAEEYLIPVASGVIAGVSIMGVIVACLNTFVFK